MRQGVYYYLLLSWLISLFAVGGSFYFEQELDLLPCPMCIGQRISMLISGILVLVVFLIINLYKRNKVLNNRKESQVLFLHKNLYPLSMRWFIGTCLVLALVFLKIGFYIAIRQVYLQSLPVGEAPACGPGLNFLIKYLPWQKIMSAIFYGSGECAKVSWSFLGLSIAGWSAIMFFVNWIILLFANWHFLFR